MTDDLVAFLRARLDEDEQTAIAATQGDWVWSREFVTPPGYHHRTIGPLEPGDAAFIAHHNPARVLAEVAAKRAVVDAYAEAEAAVDGVRYPTTDVGRAEGLETAVLLLAQSYAGHPDYRPEWAPDA